MTVCLYVVSCSKELLISRWIEAHVCICAFIYQHLGEFGEHRLMTGSKHWSVYLILWKALVILMGIFHYTISLVYDSSLMYNDLFSKRSSTNKHYLF